MIANPMHNPRTAANWGQKRDKLIGMQQYCVCNIHCKIWRISTSSAMTSFTAPIGAKGPNGPQNNRAGRSARCPSFQILSPLGIVDSARYSRHGSSSSSFAAAVPAAPDPSGFPEAATWREAATRRNSRARTTGGASADLTRRRRDGGGAAGAARGAMGLVLASFSVARRAGFGDECGGRVRRAAAASAAFGSTSAAGGGDECGRLPLTTGGATTPSQHVGPSAFHPSALVFAAQVRQSAKSLTASRRRLRPSGDDGRRRRALPVAPPRRSHSKGDDER
ncbi:hypothetical protein ACHAWF_017806 [Thalassiosira exigua]